MSARKPRRVRLTLSPPSQPEAAVRKPGDFRDPESLRVLEAIADALIAPLAIQQAREDHAKWLANQRGPS